VQAGRFSSWVKMFRFDCRQNSIHSAEIACLRDSASKLPAMHTVSFCVCREMTHVESVR
jgi:hypothetical protein